MIIGIMNIIFSSKNGRFKSEEQNKIINAAKKVS